MENPISRRDVLTRIGTGVALASTLASSGELFGQAMAPAAGDTMASPLAAGFSDGKYTLPPLTYAYDALEPSIDAQTMHLHHDKHHQAYVDGLNKTLKELAAARANAEESPSALSGLEEDLSFNGSGHVLHTIFWSIMAPHAGGEPQGPLADAIKTSFGSTEGFRGQFAKAAGAVKGSGWAVLAYEPVGDQLIVLQAKQHDLQWFAGVVPLLPLDVWEHAYYLKYQNRRADYVKAWWDVVNWPAVNQAYVTAQHGRTT